MRAAVSSPPPRHHLPRPRRCRHHRHVFDQITKRVRSPPAAGVPAGGGGGGGASSSGSVHNLFRILLPISTVFRAATHLHLSRSRFLLARQNFEGYIPRSCTSSSLQVSRHSSLLSLSPSSAFMVSAQLTSSEDTHHTSSGVAQRSEEWFALRKDKLTTSTFSTALGFWAGNRRSELWNQKVFEPVEITFEAAARAAMDWGVLHESSAIEQYTSITGREVGSLGFAVHTGPSSGWLGASPDGVLGCYPGGGILEVKCPYNKGKPELGLPWRAMPYYYMPQVQGLMEIMDRDWVELYCWTPNGSSLFRVDRDRTYWELIHGVLHDFWWGNVVPAREAVLLGKEADVKAYEPEPKHRLTNLLIVKSRKLASEARLLFMDVKGHVEFFK